MLGFPILLSVILVILTVYFRWRSKDDDIDVVPRSTDEHFAPISVAVAPQVTAAVDDEMVEIETLGFDEYNTSRVVLERHRCAVCSSPTTTRCSRCKSVRYCSSKCQIAHWRQGHKYDCHLQVNIYQRKESSEKVEIVKRSETSSKIKYEKCVEDKMHRSGISQPHVTMPRLSTVSAESNTEPTSSREREESTSDSNTFNTVQKGVPNVKAYVKSVPSGLENSLNKYKDPSRQSSKTKTRASHSNSLLSVKKESSLEGVVLDDVDQRRTSKDVSELDPLLIEKQKNSTEHFSSSFFPIRGVSTSSTLPPSGSKSSLHKVMQHPKTSQPKKLPIRHAVLEAPTKLNLKSAFQYDTFRRLYSSNAVELKPFGLVNCGNSCYANAVLQCLTYTRPLTLFLLERLHTKQCLKETWCFMCEFERLILKAREGYSPLSPVRILSNISHLGHGREEDAHEFLRYSVDTMQSVCIQQVNMTGPVVEETTLIGMTFGGYLHSKIKCMKCRNKSEKYERMMDLTVEIDGDIKTLEQALKRFTASEILEGDNKYYCSRCKSYEKAKKKLTVFQVPNILTIVLKRFQAGNFSKLNKRVQFPEILNMTPYMTSSNDRSSYFSLYGVVVHLNAMNAAISGHYVCYVKNYHEKWFKIDDSVVVSVDVDKVLAEEAYMLLYARHSPRFPALISNGHNGKHYEVNLHAVSHQTYGKSYMSEPNHYNPNINGYVKNHSYLEEWVTHSVESIPLMDSSSEASSLFSHSEEGTCSTPSTKDSPRVEDFSRSIFG